MPNTTSKDDELREKLIELDGELWDYQLDALVPFIKQYGDTRELDGRREVRYEIMRGEHARDEYLLVKSLEERELEIATALKDKQGEK